MPDWPFLAIFFTIISVKFKQCPRLTALILITEEHSKKDEISFQNVYGHREPVNLRIQ